MTPREEIARSLANNPNPDEPPRRAIDERGDFYPGKGNNAGAECCKKLRARSMFDRPGGVADTGRLFAPN